MMEVSTSPSTIPLRNLENESDRMCELKDTQVKEFEDLIEKNSENFTSNNKPTAPSVENKNFKIKKGKIKKCRGEKRKFSEKTETLKKTKRTKKDEKATGSDQNLNPKLSNIQLDDVEVLFQGMSPLTPQSESLPKTGECVIIENDSDVENRESLVKQRSKQMSSRKSKAIANTCRETLEILLRLGSDTLDSMNTSLRILNSHNLLSNRYISMETLIDLIELALKANKLPSVEKEIDLSKIVAKSIDEMCSNSYPSKAKKNILSVPLSPKNKLAVPEDMPNPILVSKEVEENQTLKMEDSDEKTEESPADVEQLEKIQEPTVEKSGKNFCITNYFKKLKKTVEERDKNERFSCFTTKSDMFLAPKLGGELSGERRQKFEEEFSNQTCSANYLVQHVRVEAGKRNKKVSADDTNLRPSEKNRESSKEISLEGAKSNAAVTSVDEVVEVPNSGAVSRKRVALVRVVQAKVETTQAVSRTKAKLLQFHENRRPPYWGTWRRKSETVRPRKPLAKDKLLNYEVDSDDEWESEEEPGESLHGSDDEKEPEEDYEVDNDFFVPHGYLSDDENPEKEKDLSPKTKLNLLEEQFTSEQKQKTRKMTPFVFGSFWVFRGVASEGNIYQDLQLDRLQFVPWTKTPIQVEGEEEEKKSELTAEQVESGSQSKKVRQKTFPEEEIPNLIKMIHGSPQNSDLLAKKFLLYWEGEKIQDGKRPGLTKICVLKKIKELAAWQAGQEKGKMCWQVPKETRREFGAEVEPETPPKKPRKCFIWKFVKKADKAGEVGSSSSPAEPEVVLLDS